MTMGHYATALLPWARNKSWPLWLLLVCGQWGDLVWLALSVVGVEPTQPENVLDVTIATMKVPMIWSHGLVSALVRAVLVAGLVFAFTKQRALAAWCAGLIVLHVACDGLVGWKHEVLGAGSYKWGFGFFDQPSTILPAIVLEAAFGAACVWWFLRERAKAGAPVAPRRKVALYAVFSASALLFAGSATVSMRELLARF